MRVLLWLEPYPLGDHRDLLLETGRVACAALQSAAARGELEARLFACGELSSAMEAEFPELSRDLFRPLDEEQLRLVDQLDAHWAEERLAQWVEFVDGRAEICALHAEILERIHREYPFELVVLVSESRAIEAAARKVGAGFAYLTPAPPRAPFPSFVAIDGASTSRRSAMSRIPEALISATSALPAQTWLTTSARNPGAERGVIEGCFLWPQGIAGLLPREPYVYVPLHLADQLEALRLGEEGTPAAFLARAVKHYRESGLTVVVRGNPAALQRASNLGAQSRALAVLDRDDEGVVVVPTQLPLSDTVGLLAQAEVICTLDPSSAFEALLVGKPVTTPTHLSFDVGGQLRARGFGYRPTETSARWDTQLLHVLMGHVLLPSEDVVRGIGLASVFELIAAEHQAGGEFGESFWHQWISTLRPGLESLAHRDGRRPARSVSRRALADGTSLLHLSAGDLFLSGDSILVDAVTREGVECFVATRLSGSLVGHIDAVEPHPEKHGLVQVRGWVFERESAMPPSMVLVTGRSRLFAAAEVTDARLDVAAQHRLLDGRCGFSVGVRAPAAGEERHLLFITADNCAQSVPCRVGSFTPFSARSDDELD